MPRIEVDANKCKACYLCVKNCIGCAMCYMMCPDIAITVIKD